MPLILLCLIHLARQRNPRLFSNHRQMLRFLDQVLSNILPYNPDQLGSNGEEVGEEEDLEEGLHGPGADDKLMAEVEECKEEEVEGFQKDVEDPTGD